MLKGLRTKISNINQPKKIQRNLDALISSIEEIKEDFNLEKILNVLGEKLYDLDISTIMTVIDDDQENLVLRHISLSKAMAKPEYLPLESVLGKKIAFNRLVNYQAVLATKKGRYMYNRQKSLKINFPELSGFINNGKYHSIITPIIIRSKAIGIIEYFSPSLKEEYLGIIDSFNKNLVKNIANVILYQEIHSSQQRYRELVDNANEIVLTINRDGLIAFANNAFFKITGYTKKDVLNGLYFYSITYKDDLPETRVRFKLRLKGEVLKKNYEYRIVTKSGSVVWISFNGVLVYKDKKIVGVQAIIRDISERIKLQARYKEAKEHYEQVIDAIQDGICVINKKYEIVSYNRTFAEKTGYQIKELKGLNYREIIPRYNNGSFVDFCCADCQENCVIEDTFRSGQALSLVKKSHNKSGAEHYHQIDVFPKKNPQGFTYEAVITLKDISQKVKDEQKIARLSKFNQRILDNSPVSILVLDKQAEVISANGMAEMLIGEARESLVGKKIYDFSDIKANIGLVEKYEKLLKQGIPFYFDSFSYYSSASRQKKYLNIYAVPLFDQGGALEGAISMALDNTEAVRAKNKLKELNRELESKVMERTGALNEINKKLEEAIILKSKFISDASHELRTPLTVIQGNLDLSLREAELAGCTPPESYELILGEVDRMTRILSDLTMLTNVDSNSEKFSYETVDLGKIVTATCRSLSVLADQKKISLFFKRGAKNYKIDGDEPKLEKLLLNIIRNAIKYTNEKGEIHVDVGKDGDSAKITVADNGIGIPQEDLPYIFERFYRVDKSRSRDEGGTGLGLAICKWIAEEHGGRIEVESELGKGTIFNIFLPFKQGGS